MADNDITIALDERTALGKGLNKLREEGIIPAVIHDHGKPSIHVMGNSTMLQKAYNQAGKNHPVTIKVGSKQYAALIKEASYRPPKHILQHVVFQAFKQNETVEAEIPITLEGDAPAERKGLIVLHQLDSVMVQAMPKDLPDHFSVDATTLDEIGDKLSVSDIVVPSGVTILTEPEHAIATVAETRATAAAADEEEAEAPAEEAAPASE